MKQRGLWGGGYGALDLSYGCSCEALNFVFSQAYQIVFLLFPNRHVCFSSFMLRIKINLMDLLLENKSYISLYLLAGLSFLYSKLWPFLSFTSFLLGYVCHAMVTLPYFRMFSVLHHEMFSNQLCFPMLWVE